MLINQYSCMTFFRRLMENKWLLVSVSAHLFILEKLIDGKARLGVAVGGYPLESGEQSVSVRNLFENVNGDQYQYTRLSR